MSKPIIARVTKDTNGQRAGAEFGFASEEDAARILGEGNFEVVRYGDGSPLDASADTTPSLSTMTRDELNAHAGSLGIEAAADLPNKEAVIAAIEAAS